MLAIALIFWGMKVHWATSCLAPVGLSLSECTSTSTYSLNFALREHPQDQCLCRPQRKECSKRKKAIFCELLAFAVPKDGMPPEKTSWMVTKPWNLQKFPTIRYIALCVYILGNLLNNVRILLFPIPFLPEILASALVCLGCRSKYRHKC